MTFNPKDYKVLAFDIYGTLIDWETGIYQALLPLLSSLPETSNLHPSQQTLSANRAYLLTTYTKYEVEIQAANPTLLYPEILALIWKSIAKELSIPTTDTAATEFGSTIGTWGPFPDTVAAMQELGKAYKLIVLSNVDHASFSRTLSGPLKGVHFDAIYTAEDIGSYKPDLRNFQYLISHAEQDFGAKKDEILVVAMSLLHDHRPAKTIGLQPSIWISRKPDGKAPFMGGGTLEDVKGEANLAGSFDSLGDFAASLKT